MRSSVDEMIISALLTHPTARDAAKAAGISESRVSSRLKKPDFQEKYREARQRLIEQTTTYLQGLISEAVETIHSVMKDPETPRQVKLNAADCLLRNCYKMTEENDILTRITELEKVVEENKSSLR